MTWYESLANMFDPLLTPMFFFILKMPPVWGIMTVALIITIITTLAYKLMTDQVLMKTLKEELKVLQKDMKKYKQDAAKVMEVNKKLMNTNMKYMKNSFKPMFITMIPIIIIFGWVGGHLAYEPINPGSEFNLSVDFMDDIEGNVSIIVPNGIEVVNGDVQNIVESRAVWVLKGTEGDYAVQINYGDKQYEKFIQITSEKRYATVQKFVNDDNIKTINVENNKVKIFGLSWFWIYLIAAVAFNSGLRKLLKLY